jgi:hypothetical protein
MFLYDLGSLAPSDVQKCAKSVVLPASYMSSKDANYLPGFTSGSGSTEKTNWVPIVVGAAVVAGVIWWATSSVGRLPPMANPRGATAEQWHKLRSDYLEAERAYDDLDNELSYKYGSKHGHEWASRIERKKLDQLRKRKDRIGEKMFAILDKVSPRDWHHGVPAHWIYSKLSWEDAIRPANEPLSVAPPTAYGY